MHAMSEASVQRLFKPSSGDAAVSFDDLAALLRQRAGGPLQPAAGPVRPASSPSQQAAESPAATLPFRPTLRRPMALVHVVDDGREGGEVIRMRRDRLVIGRGDGDIVIPHDISMSPLHAAIEWLGQAGWQLLDLGSSTGTFVRVVSARLTSGSVVQVGKTRLRFEELSPTHAWFVEQQPRDAGQRHECRGPLATVGRAGSGCHVDLADSFVSPLHATVQRTPRGWRITNAGCNGLWVRIEAPVRMTAASQFLCGEQRFVFEPLG
jgi:pSer/pThr/pTyr-binding forkhead associated (FHA) protein